MCPLPARPAPISLKLISRSLVTPLGQFGAVMTFKSFDNG